MDRAACFRIAGGLIVCALAAAGQELRFAELGDLHLESGEVMRKCRIGYRTFGKVTTSPTNVVLFPTWFTGTTAQLTDMIGPGKLIDSSRYYVAAVDALGDGVSSSPSNSKEQPRMRFPRFTIRDLVESQYRLLTEVLNVRHLYAVMGISMGGMQTFQWAVAYPDFLDRAIPIVGTPRQTSYDLLLWNAEKHAIEADVNWRHGDYSERPVAAMRTVGDIHNLALETPRRRASQISASDYRAYAEKLEKNTLERFDTNDWYRQLEAMIEHDVARPFGGDMGKAAKAVRARMLVIVAETDHMVNPLPALEFARLLGARTLVLDSDCGHLATGCERPRLEAAIQQFLSEP